jgi:hypothetical protein
MHHPTCHPVALNIFLAEEMVKVRPHMLGKEAKWTCPGQEDVILVLLLLLEWCDGMTINS